MGEFSIKVICARIGRILENMPKGQGSFVSENKKSLSIALSIAILALIIYLVGPGKLISAFKGMEKKYFLFAVLIYLGTILLSAIRWSTLIGMVEKPVNCLSTFQLLTIDKLSNAFFPTSAVGITARTLLLQRKHGIMPSKGFATILLDYGFEMFASLALGIPIIILMHSKLSFSASGVLYLCMLLLGLGTLGVVLINTPKVSRKIEVIKTADGGSGILSRLTKHRLFSKALEFLTSFKVIVNYPFSSLNAMVISLCIKLSEALRLMMLFKAFGMGLPFYHFLLFEIVWVMISMFAITPGGIGAAESGKIAIFSMVPDVTTSAATPVVFIDRFITFWLILILGALFLLLSHRQYLFDNGSDNSSVYRSKWGEELGFMPLKA
ncbi:MAG: flippase-like domain-containing protein [Candidatus Methanofastidiosa archaeon]|nr:flippase-like domain-containing protein [Candidatus Methanofastidiosa archaeon]